MSVPSALVEMSKERIWCRRDTRQTEGAAAGESSAAMSSFSVAHARALPILRASRTAAAERGSTGNLASTPTHSIPNAASRYRHARAGKHQRNKSLSLQRSLQRALSDGATLLHKTPQQPQLATRCNKEAHDLHDGPPVHSLIRVLDKGAVVLLVVANQLL